MQLLQGYVYVGANLLSLVLIRFRTPQLARPSATALTQHVRAARVGSWTATTCMILARPTGLLRKKSLGGHLPLKL